MLDSFRMTKTLFRVNFKIMDWEFIAQPYFKKPVCILNKLSNETHLCSQCLNYTKK